MNQNRRRSPYQGGLSIASLAQREVARSVSGGSEGSPSLCRRGMVHTFFVRTKKVCKESRQRGRGFDSPSPLKTPSQRPKRGLHPSLETPAAWRSNRPEATVLEAQAAFFEKWAAYGGPGVQGARHKNVGTARRAVTAFFRAGTPLAAFFSPFLCPHKEMGPPEARPLSQPSG